MKETLYLGTLLALAHAAIPNHWIPIVVLGRTYDWSRGRVVRIAALCGGAHVLSTILIGVVVGLAGKAISTRYEVFSHYGAPAILVGLGLLLIVLDLLGQGHHHGGHGHDHGPMVLPHEHPHCEHEHEHHPPRESRAAIVSVTLAMFLSPCIELESYYLRAALLGWAGILWLSVVYLLVTVSGVIFLVLLFSAGYQRVRWHFLEHHERLVSGAVLILAGLAAYLFH